jgi:hypothetical protein
MRDRSQPAASPITKGASVNTTAMSKQKISALALSPRDRARPAPAAGPYNRYSRNPDQSLYCGLRHVPAVPYDGEGEGNPEGRAGRQCRRQNEPAVGELLQRRPGDQLEEHGRQGEIENEDVEPGEIRLGAPPEPPGEKAQEDQPEERQRETRDFNHAGSGEAPPDTGRRLAALLLLARDGLKADPAGSIGCPDRGA